ncbi:hypothetical protein EMCRGX_G021216 [Ephydatia muelleri]
MKKPRRIVPPSQSTSSVLDRNLTIESPGVISCRHRGSRQRLESRTPLEEGPTPSAYVSKVNILSWNREGPRWPKYSRDLLPYSNSQPWTFNVNGGARAPTMCSYTSPNVLGTHCPSKRDAPCFTMAARRQHPHQQQRGAESPGPNRYQVETATHVTTRHFPSFSIGVKRDTQQSASSPGPAHYHPNYTILHPHKPAYTMRSKNYVKT